jgi:hypothetical protein
MVARVPILGQHHIGEFLGDVVDGWDDFLATVNGKCSAGAEIILHIDHQQHVTVGNLHRGPFHLPGATAPNAPFNVDLPAEIRNHPRDMWRSRPAKMKRFGFVRVD